MPYNQDIQTKAEVLTFLWNIGFTVPKPYYFTVKRWHNQADSILQEIKNSYPQQTLVVRSSSLSEDQNGQSMAGAFESVLNVSNTDEALSEAIQCVISSYTNSSPGDQILIQPMVKNVVMSGVIMSKCLEDGSPYFSINYDDETGLTDSVTSGTAISKTVYVYRGSLDSHFDSSRINSLVKQMHSIENALGTHQLDVEFAMDDNQVVHILQARPISVCGNWKKSSDIAVDKQIRYLADFLDNFLGYKKGILGRKSVLGIMPDWNPAEIIGVNPRPMALSLYQYLITDTTWSIARADMGYRKIPPDQLMVTLSGRPYIDTRASFNSFIPKDMKNSLGEKLIDQWIQRLNDSPEFHDKIEFEIIFSSLEINFKEKIDQRYPNIFNATEQNEIFKHYQSLTNQNVKVGSDSSLYKALENIEKLKQIQHTYGDTSSSSFSISRTLRDVLQDCIELGTHAFSIIARHGFIAENILRGLVSEKTITAQRLQKFKSCLSTVSSEFSKDQFDLNQGSLSLEDFIHRYGHLRPGTYDILSPKYADHSDMFIKPNQQVPIEVNDVEFSFTQDELKNINLVLSKNGFEISAEDLVVYTEKSIIGREYAKFVFTKSISYCLDLLKQWGLEFNLSTQDMSWLKIKDVLALVHTPILSDFNTHYNQIIHTNRTTCESGHFLKLSHLIRSSRDIFVVAQQRNSPNFITKEKVAGEVLFLDSQSSYNIPLAGKIVCIVNADPGFDWIFAQNIVGLITQFGGTNSHMSIRCSEFNLPAAIGVGDVLFSKILKEQHIVIDAENQMFHYNEV